MPSFPAIQPVSIPTTIQSQVVQQKELPYNSSLKRQSLNHNIPCLPRNIPSHMRSASFSRKRIGFTLRAEVFAGIFGVDLEEVVEHDEENGGAAEKDG